MDTKYRYFSGLAHGLTRRFGYLVILAPIVATCGICSLLRTMPVPDCGVATNVGVTGIVSNQDQKPIAGAEILIRSKQQTSCPNSVPIDDLLLITDQDGSFNGIIPHIAEDDILEVIVSADGYVTGHLSYVTYVDFESPLEITLTERDQSN